MGFRLVPRFQTDMTLNDLGWLFELTLTIPRPWHYLANDDLHSESVRSFIENRAAE